jgi:hypothetical protein
MRGDIFRVREIGTLGVRGVLDIDYILARKDFVSVITEREYAFDGKRGSLSLMQKPIT